MKSNENQARPDDLMQGLANHLNSKSERPTAYLGLPPDAVRKDFQNRINERDLRRYKNSEAMSEQGMNSLRSRALAAMRRSKAEQVDHE